MKRTLFVVLAAALFASAAQAETIRVAIGTQDTTINTAAGGALIRELHLLDKYLPHDGRTSRAVRRSPMRWSQASSTSARWRIFRAC